MAKFSAASMKARSQLHPLLRQLVDAAIEQMDFKILDATRGRLAQEKAFKSGNSKVRFGNSAHNYVPAIAMDLFPAPFDWDDKKSFVKLQMEIIRPLAKKLNIPIRQGIDWNGDGNISDGWDMPHVELHPWREWAKKSKLFEE